MLPVCVGCLFSVDDKFIYHQVGSSEKSSLNKTEQKDRKAEDRKAKKKIEERSRKWDNRWYYERRDAASILFIRSRQPTTHDKEFKERRKKRKENRWTRVKSYNDIFKNYDAKNYLKLVCFLCNLTKISINVELGDDLAATGNRFYPDFSHRFNDLSTRFPTWIYDLLWNNEDSFDLNIFTFLTFHQKNICCAI